YAPGFGAGPQGQLPMLATELVAEKVDVIVTAGGPSTNASRRATSTIPIVMALVGAAEGLGPITRLAPRGGRPRRASATIPIVRALVGDADGSGLSNSLAHPGGNVTGVTDQSAELSAKRLELLKEALPRAERMAVLYNADDQGMVLRYDNVAKAAQSLRVSVQQLGVREPNDFETAFAAMTK